MTHTSNKIHANPVSFDVTHEKFLRQIPWYDLLIHPNFLLFFYFFFVDVFLAGSQKDYLTIIQGIRIPFKFLAL
ncbi:hypothetical protein RCL_jg23380.t1 [Rhizophagus clarus]|uniref:Uncharacterized protein n=1 Tax=Rhizophagus clarus TaxID=94130 RepID=A0A8H3L462_9GLOM|nr:hypothetical protein RCL_jg23380.t1 [Rhizophagus clarus]